MILGHSCRNFVTEYLIALQGTCTKVHIVFPGLSKEKFNTLMASIFNAGFNILNKVFYYKKCNFEGYIALNYGRKKYTKESM